MPNATLQSSILLGALALSSGALAQLEAPVRLLGSDGRWMEGVLLSADAERWRLVDSKSRAEVSLRCGDFVAFLADRTRAVGSGGNTAGGASAGSSGSATVAPEPVSYGLLETIDGQRLPGNFRQGSDANYWDHRWIGSIPIPIDQVASIRFRGARTPERRPDADSLLFMNGDLLTGFLDKLGQDIEFEPLATDGAPAEKRRVPVDRVAAIALARTDSPAPTGRAGGGARFWVLDGSVVDGVDLRFDAQDGWGFTLHDPLLAKVRGNRTSDNNAANPIAGMLAPGALIPLATLGKPVVSVPAGEIHLGIAESVRVGAADRALLGLAPIDIAGPAIAGFALPALDSTAPITLSCDLVLAEPAPQDVAVDVEIRVGTATSERVRLDAAHRRVPIVMELPAVSAPSIIEIRVTDGGNGLAGDAIVVERGCLVIRRR